MLAALMLVQAAEVRASIVVWLVILVLLELFHASVLSPSVRRMMTLSEIGRDRRRLGERRIGRQRMPGPDQADRDVGIAVRVHLVDLAIERRPIRSERDIDRGVDGMMATLMSPSEAVSARSVASSPCV
jgi:hypothetical protein